MSDYIELISVNNGMFFKGHEPLSAGDVIESESGTLYRVKGRLYVHVGGDIYNYLLDHLGVEDFPTYKAYYYRSEAQHE